MQYKNYYQILGVERDAKQDEIKRAYRKLARKYHPDVSKETGAEDKFKEVNEAYEVLGDPEKRVAYDQLGSNWKHGQDFRPPPNWDANFEFSGGDFSFGSHGNFSDFFEQIFGGGRFGFAHDESSTRGFTRGGRGRQSSRGQSAEDYHAKIGIDLEDSFHGTNRNITLQTPVVTKDGHVTTKPHVLNVKIPKGICEGQRIRLKGQGATGDDGKRGDLILEIVFNPHPVYRVNGRDLEMDLPIAPWEAALGETIRVPTLAGNVEMKIPANSQSDQKLRLKGRGLPGKTSSENGNLVCVLKIVLPSSTHAKAKALYEQMRRDISFNPRETLEVKHGK